MFHGRMTSPGSLDEESLPVVGTKGADPKFIRFWNERLVVDVLGAERSPQRIARIAQLTGLTPAALGHVLRGLENKGWVKASNCVERRRGRPPQLYSLVRPQGCVFGLDIGRRAARVVSIDMLGNVIARYEIRLNGASSDTVRLEKIDCLLEALLPDESLPVWIVGMAAGDDVVGLDAEGDADSEEPSLMTLLRRQLRARGLTDDVVQVSDRHAAAYAAQMVGAAQGCDDILYVHLGWHPKFCVVMNGDVRAGAHGRAGHLRVQNLMPGVEDMRWPEWACKELDDGRFWLVEEAADGNADALAKVDEYLMAVAPHVGFAAAVVDPALVVVGGAFSPVKQRVVEGIRREVERQAGYPIEVVDSGLDQFGAATGAALNAQRVALDTLISLDAGATELSTENLRRLRAREPR